MTTTRTMKGLRETLFQELDKLVSGGIPPTRARAAAMLGNAIIDSVVAELPGDTPLTDAA